MTADVPLDRVLASVRSTSDRPIPHPRQEPTMTAPHPSPAGLSPLLDQLDEALRNRGTSLYADEVYAATVPAALPKLTAAVRAVAERAEREVKDAEAGARYAAEVNQGVLLASEAARADAWRTVQHLLAAALTPGADTAGATA